MERSTLDEVVRVRVHPEHKAAWKRQAARDARSLSNWLRWLADRRMQEVAHTDAEATRGAPEG